MRSQMSRQSQGASFQTGSNSTHEESDARMQSSLIRGDYRHLNQSISRSWRTSDFSESDSTEEESDSLSELFGSSSESDSTEEKSDAGIPSSSVREDRRPRKRKYSFRELFDSSSESDSTEEESYSFSDIFDSSSESDSTKEESYAFDVCGWRRSGVQTVQQRSLVCRKDPAKPVTEEEINEYIDEQWSAEDFVRNGISESDFTESNIIKCIRRRKWDCFFNTIGSFGHRFTTAIIDACLANGWSIGMFARLNGLQSKKFTPDQVTQCVQRTYQNDVYDLQELHFSSERFTEEHITIGLKNKWGAFNFEQLGIKGSLFTEEHITTCLQQNWAGCEFRTARIPGTNFTDKNITECIQKGWGYHEFQEQGISGSRFTEAHINLCLEKDWEVSSFKYAGIPGTNFTDKNITACIEKGWNRWDFIKYSIPGTNFTNDNITVCIQNGWKAKDFLALEIFNDRFTADHITACIRNGWRGWELRGFGITEERLRQTNLKENDYAENGWTDWDLNYFKISDEEMSKKIFFLSYLYPRQELQKKYPDQQSAEVYNEGYQELYQSRKETTSRIDWNIPEVEEQKDLKAARESIRDLQQKLAKKFEEIAVTTSSNLLYDYTMHVDPNEATLLYCIKHIVDRIVKDYLWNANPSGIISNLIKLCNSVRTYINEKNGTEKKRKKEDIIQACEAFLPLLEEGGDLHDIISFVKELEETFGEDKAPALNPSGKIDDYVEIDPGNEEQHSALFQQNIFNRHKTMKKALNYDYPNAPGGSDDAYTHHSGNYNSWLQTYPAKDEVSYSKLTNIGLYQMSCKCARTDQNIKLYRYIEYDRDPLSQINGYDVVWDEAPEEEILKNLLMQRLQEAQKAGILLGDPAFMSTGFAPVPTYARAVMMVICCPAGTPMYITNFTNSYKEVVLPRHTKLKILKVEDVGGTSKYGEPCQIVLTVEVTGVGM